MYVYGWRFAGFGYGYGYEVVSVRHLKGLPSRKWPRRKRMGETAIIPILTVTPIPTQTFAMAYLWGGAVA